MVRQVCIVLLRIICHTPVRRLVHLRGRLQGLIITVVEVIITGTVRIQMVANTVRGEDDARRWTAEWRKLTHMVAKSAPGEDDERRWTEERGQLTHVMQKACLATHMEMKAAPLDGGDTRRLTVMLRD